MKVLSQVKCFITLQVYVVGLSVCVWLESGQNRAIVKKERKCFLILIECSC